MGRYARKCGRIVEVAVMEVTQVVGVRTRARTLELAAGSTVHADAVVGGVSARKRKMTEEDMAVGGSEVGEMQMAYLQLRNRSLVMAQRSSKSGRNLGGKHGECLDRGRISRCSSISSCEGGEEGDGLRIASSGGQKPWVDLGSVVCYVDWNRDRRETTSSPTNVIYSSEMESTAERESRQSTPQLRMPSPLEIEEFFAVAEKSEKQRFISKYNFDVDQEAPLEGRYEWVRLNP